MHSETKLPISHHNWSDETSTLVTKQFALGQRAFTSGLWIDSWILAQSEYHKTLKTRKHGITVVTNMIKNLQKLIRKLWFSRNDALHKNNQSRINKEKSKDCDLLIDSLFHRKRLIPLNLLVPSDRKYFRSNIQALKKMRLTRKERWVKDAEHVLDKYDTENESEQVRRCRSFFMHRDDG